MKIPYLVILAALSLVVLAAAPRTADLVWSDPNPAAAAVSGYRIYTSPQSNGVYTLQSIIPVPSTQATVINVPAEKTWFRVTAFTATQESPPSNPVPLDAELLAVFLQSVTSTVTITNVIEFRQQTPVLQR